MLCDSYNYVKLTVYCVAMIVFYVKRTIMLCETDNVICEIDHYAM